MKRLPLAASFVLFILLCASIAYWALQLFKPPVRQVAAPPRAAKTEVRPEAAAALFGGKSGPVAVASNYQLKGVIFSGNPRDSVAILSADGKPAQAIRVGREVMPGVTIKEVHREYVLLSEDGTTKRVELPESTKGQFSMAGLAPVPVQPGQGAAAPAPVPPAPSIPARPAPQAPMQTAPVPPPTVVVSPPPSAQPTVPGTMPPATATAPPAVAPPPPAPAPVPPTATTPFPAPATPPPATASPAAPVIPGSPVIPGAPVTGR